MLKLILFSFLFFYAYGAYYEDTSPYWVKHINSQKGNWKAGFNPFLTGKSLDQIKRLMGTKLDGKGAKLKMVGDRHEDRALPASFTSGVDKWPNCKSTISFIKDQADCGSCWAVAASEVVADRSCIANYGSMPNDRINEAAPAIDMSAEQIMSCCNWCGQGCGGGYISDAMRYWAWTGVVTGGWYGSNCGCQPYQIPPCGPSGCSGPEAQTPACTSSCRSGYPTAFSADKHKAADHYGILPLASSIQNEIYNNGPVECGFSVYENFMHYKSGVYDKKEGQLLGGHAVKIIGWGTENGVPYWLINNSWNVTWGMSGQFKFKRGGDLCGMESQCATGKGKASDSNLMLVC